MIHYTKFMSKNKNAEWITFVHGAGGSSTIWYKQIKYFSKKYNLLLLDLRGHGKSKSISINPFKKKYTFNYITNDILEVIDAEKIKKMSNWVLLETIMLAELLLNQHNK